MRLSLIGMSGSGKSHWSFRLAGLGFRCFCCDDLIEAKLAQELIRSDGSMMELGEWMGFPYQPHYRVRESRYLECEIQVLKEILDNLESEDSPSDPNMVIDTTGSVIYTGEEILSKIRRYTTVVHLSTPPEVKEQMLKAYVAKPRPVLWRDLFGSGPKETSEDALVRCYPKLLSARERLYERYADVSIDYYSRNGKGFGVKDLLKTIGNIEHRTFNIEF